MIAIPLIGFVDPCHCLAGYQPVFKMVQFGKLQLKSSLLAGALGQSIPPYRVY